MMYHLSFFKPLIFLFFFFVSTCLEGQSHSNYIFILDGSGSMWQKAGATTKIAVAKEVLGRLIDGVPATTSLGLVVYGHRQKEDCADIETLVPLAPLDKPAVREKLAGIDPKGKTPIAASLQHSIDLLKEINRQATVVLLSDGLETCPGDACRLVAEARDAGIVLTMHVIGLALEEKDLSALECIAQAGGGQYFPADNAEELLDALEQSVEEPPAAGGFLAVTARAESQLTDVGIKVFPKGQSREIAFGRTYTAPATNPRILRLPAGAYRVEVTALQLEGAPKQVLDDVKVAEGDTLLKEFDFSFGELSVAVTRNGELSDATVRVLTAGGRTQAAGSRTYTSVSSNPTTFRIPPGAYDIEIGSVEIAGRPVIKLENQVLRSGQPLALAHNFQSGLLQVGVQQGETLIDAAVSVYSQAGGQSVAGGRTYTSSNSNPKTFVLEPGRYRVEIKPVRPKDLPARTLEVTVEAEEATEETVRY